MPKKQTRSDTSTKKRTKVKRVVKTAKKQSKRVSNEGEWFGIPYESGCELAAIQFFMNLKKNGYVEKIDRSESWLVTDPVINTYVEQLKRSSRTVQQTVMLGQSYTADFKIIFNKKALGKFIWCLGSGTKWEKNMFVVQPLPDGTYQGYFEVKPDKARNDTTPKAMNSMKSVYQRHGIFINLFRPDRCFSGLFMPYEYSLTPTGLKRKLRFKPRTLQQYLDTLKENK